MCTLSLWLHITNACWPHASLFMLFACDYTKLKRMSISHFCLAQQNMLYFQTIKYANIFPSIFWHHFVSLIIAYVANFSWWMNTSWKKLNVLICEYGKILCGLNIGRLVLINCAPSRKNSCAVMYVFKDCSPKLIPRQISRMWNRTLPSSNNYINWFE